MHINGKRELLKKLAIAVLFLQIIWGEASGVANCTKMSSSTLELKH